MSDCGPLSIVSGRALPALSVSWEPSPNADNFTGFIVFMGECDLAVAGDDWPESEPVCTHCILEEGGEQLGRGLDLAHKHGQVDWDNEYGEWFLPETGETAE